MAGLLDRAKTLLAGKKSVKPAVGFSIRCLCGEQIVGQRRDEHQSIICPSCSQPIFVLARSPLPELALPPAMIAVAAPMPAARKAVGRRIDEGVPVESAAAPMTDPTLAMRHDELDELSNKPKRRPRRANEAVETEFPAPTESKPGLLETVGKAGKALIPPRRWFSTPRLVLAGVALLVVGTVYWQLHARQLRQMREELVPSGRRGLQALFEGKMDEARERLGFAVRALDALGDDFPDAGRFRQAFREVDLVANLSFTPFEDAAAGVDEPSKIAESLRGRRLLIDAEVEKSPTGWQVGTIGYIGDRPVEVDPAGLPLFDRLQLAAKTRLIFGATIADARLDSENRWIVRFDPNSGVLLTDPRLFADLGLSRDANATQTRERQQAMVEKMLGLPGATPGTP